VSAELATVTWLTGIVTDIESGPSPFSIPPLVVVEPGGAVVAVASEDEAAGAAGAVDVRTVTGFAVEDADRAGEATAVVLEALAGAREVACDLASLPGSLVAALLERDVGLIDVRPELQRARAVKDSDEIDAIRAAIVLSDAGQAAARAGLSAGRTELELWGAVRRAIEELAGERVPLLADFVTGARTAEVGGPPGGRRVSEVDLLLADLVPRRAGWWADSCATVAVGAVPGEVRAAHAAACAALERATEMLRPGVRAGDVDAAARELIAGAGGSYPHHTGHGLGTSYHEEPRIIPGSDRVLEPGMVIALEPGAYGDGWGVRVERVVLVTDAEPEVLSGHDIAL
jgi:Xaa-Pro dipeptidase